MVLPSSVIQGLISLPQPIAPPKTPWTLSTYYPHPNTTTISAAPQHPLCTGLSQAITNNNNLKFLAHLLMCQSASIPFSPSMQPAPSPRPV